MRTIALSLTASDGSALNDRVEVTVFDLQSPHRYQAAGFATDSFRVDVPVDDNTTIRILLSSSNHHDVDHLAFLNGDLPVRLVVPVNPEQVLRINGPAFGVLSASAQRVLAAAAGPQFIVAGTPVTGQTLYDGLDLAPLLKAAFLNIVAKAGATTLAGTETVLDYFRGLRELRQDRFFVDIDPKLIGIVASSNGFHSVPDALHQPLPGYEPVSSYKTFDRYGNLQLTFQRTADGSKAAADVDIDDAQGIPHLYQVVRNAFTGGTNPYDIHEILLGQQPRVDPRYGFVFESPAAP